MIARADPPAAKPVLIIGAGISGLSTARLLAQDGIPVIVFEQSAPDRSQGYSITLRDWAFKPLLSDLDDGTTQDIFEKCVCVDRAVGGCGWIDLTLRDNSTGVTLLAPEPPKPGEAQQALFRANRSALRNFLAQEVELRYEHKLKSFEGQAGNVKAVFENGEEVEGCLLVAADGLHSTVRRTLTPKIKPALLPVVVFHGDVYVTREDFEKRLKPSLGDSNVLGGVGDDFNTPITISSADENGVHLDWSYSRPIEGPHDPLWMPERAQTSAAPARLLEEIAAKPLVPPFSTLVNVDAIQAAPVYNWLSRSVFIGRQHLDRAAAQGVIYVGDASHAMPIFGGEGGNHAMLDGVELAGLIAQKERDDAGLSGPAVEDLARLFYDGSYKRCQDAVRRCRQRFALLHRPLKDWRQLAEMAKLRAAEKEKEKA